MIQPGYYNQLAASFSLFIAHELEYYWQAYNNYSGQLYPTTDPNFSQYNVWGSPFRQWVSDESIFGAQIPSGVYNDGTFVPRGTSGLSIDFNKGRVLTSVGALSNPTASYALREFNIYYTTLSEPDLLIERAFDIQPQIPQATGALFWNQEPVPCIFIKNQFTENTPWAFGGLDLANTSMTCIVISDSQYKLDACCGALADSARKYFPNFPIQDLPFNVLGDYKTVSGYNYRDLCDNYTGYLVFSNTVKVSKFSEENNKQLNKTVYAALVDFELELQRTPRRY